MNALLLLALLSSDAKTPYKVRLVVSVRKHPSLTPVFVEQTARKLRDAVQAALGDMGRVTLDAKHPLHEAIAKEGLDKAVGAHRARDGFLTYCVRISYAGSRYEIESRMHDGLTGNPGPVTHTDRTRDRDFVARTAALLIDQGMGLHGTILGEPDGDKVKVELHAGALGDMSKRVKVNDVFAFVKLPEAGQGREQPFTVLQVEKPPVGGIVECRAWSHYKLANFGPWTGARAVQLPARNGGVRVRIVETKEGKVEPITERIQLFIRKHGWDGDALMEMAASNHDTTKRATFDRVAFVTLVKAGKSWKFPLALLDDRVVTLTVNLGSEADNEAQERFDQLMLKSRDCVKVQNSMFDDINRLTKDPEKRKAAMERVRETITRGKADREKLAKEREEFRALDEKKRFKFDAFDARVKELIKGEAELLGTVAKLEEIEKEENDPARKEWLVAVERAKGLERQGDIGEALKIYEEGPEKFKTEALTKHVETLKTRWDIKDDNHRRARVFAYDEFAGLDTAKLKDAMPAAKDALAQFRKAGDPYGPIKLRAAALKHADRMAGEAKELRPGVRAEDTDKAELLKEIAPELQKLVKDAEDLIAKDGKG